MVKCFYHNADLDGICSAAIVHQKYPDAELIGIDYGDPFPWDTIRPGEDVWMVDFSLQPFSDMVRLRQLATLTWIDHHVSAIGDRPKAWRGIQVVGIGACALVWDFIYGGTTDTEPRPRAVELLAKYDVWNFDDSDTLAFQYGIRTYELSNDPCHSGWEGIFTGDWVQDEALMLGNAIVKYIERDNALKARALCFDHTLRLSQGDFERLSGSLLSLDVKKEIARLFPIHCLAANFGPSNSKLFDSLWDPEKYDAMLLFSYRPKNKLWTISLYTTRDDVDCSVVAKAYGGGGHKMAAGFQIKTLVEIGL